MGSKKKRKVPKSGPVWQGSSLEATRLAKPRYNGWQTGHGIHGDTKYNRAKAKRAWRNELQKGARDFPGSFTFAMVRLNYSSISGGSV